MEPGAARFDLVIFDCDGVLVDSEVLSAEVLTSVLAEDGIEIDGDIFRADFLGRGFQDAKARFERRTGHLIAAGFDGRYLTQLLAMFRQKLGPVPGVEAVLRSMITPYCVASGSNPLRLATSLDCSGLQPWFEGRVFSGADVARAKPAPDLFLHAALRMGFEPSRCLVIEDSEMGIRAALAAGMAVWHFRGGAHTSPTYVLPQDAKVDAEIADMRQLLDMFRQARLCGG